MEEEDLLLEQWKKASELHVHEDKLIWQKFYYFIAINTALYSILEFFIRNSNGANVTAITVIIPLLGLLISIFWWSMHERGSRYQERRIKQAVEVEKKFQVMGLDFDLYSKGAIRGGFKTKSVMKFVIIVILLVWIGILIFGNCGMLCNICNIIKQ